MKKIIGFTIILMLALTMGITMTGCGSDESTEVEATTQVVEETTEVTTTESESDSSFEQFKKTMDDYEAFMDSYCELLEKYNADPATFSAEYLEMNQKYVTVMSELDEIDEDELTDEELQYYLEVMGRINTRLAEVAY